MREIYDAIRAAGLEPVNIEPGRINRMPGIGKSRRNRAGWVWVSPDTEVAVIGDYASGLREVWKQDRETPLTHAERRAMRRQIQEAIAKADAERREAHQQAADRARAILSRSEAAAEDHSYLSRKQVKPHGARKYKDCLALPIQDVDGFVWSIQFIDAEGNKRMLTGGRKGGCFIQVNDAQPRRILICEGWATGSTLAEHHPASLVLAAIDAGNLKPVAVNVRRRWPDAEIVIAGDDDRAKTPNVGRASANEAARAVGGMVALPPWPDDAPLELTDFNDLAVWQGGDV